MWFVLSVAIAVAQSAAAIPKISGALTEANCPTTGDALIIESVIRVLVRCHSNDQRR
jgi:hypothetical protein